MRRLFVFLFSAVFLTSVSGQSGRSAYAYLDVPVSSRMAALGGLNVSSIDHDVTSSFQNPSLLTDQTHNTLSLNYAAYLADIKFASAAYSYNLSDNRFAVGISYADYGRFMGADEYGTLNGTFTAKDFCLNLIYARRLNRYFTAGATLKPLYSAYERYTSFALAVDMGAVFTTQNQLFSAGLTFRNAGIQLKGFHDDEDGGQMRERLPFEIDLGITTKFAHAPLRFSITLHNLQRWDLSPRLTNQTVTSINGTSRAKSDNVGFADMLFRHAIIAIDLVPGKNFYATVAYNHRRNAELRADGYKSLSGFSFGLGLRLYKFHVGFGMMPYMKGNYAYHFSFTTHINDFKK
ncbi:MAG: type IX secretion system protein PorQ [Paludibacteraceae bacterium]|nr:type IX secretion system protein PorQ [Paludibacteraceae bacterium]